MANTLTNLIPDAYVALDVVSRELCGFIPSVARDPKADRVALNQNLRIEITPANAAGGNVTPAMTLPSASDQTIGNAGLTITKSRYFPFSWTGEEQNSVDQGPGFLTIKQDQIAQAIRAAINEMETDIAVAAYQGASRAYGTAGTAPFGTAGDFYDSAQIRKILDDNGAPLSDRSLILNTAAGANIRGKQAQAHMYGDVSLLRQGVLLDQAGFAIRESAKVQSVTKGAGTGYLVNNVSGYTAGATTIAVDTGSGTILAGDIITFAGDTNKYVVATALSGGNVSIAAPGLLQSLADNTAITVGNNYSANVGFSRNSILLATRLPALPQEGDLAIDRQVITDPRTGISLEIAAYAGYRMIVYQVLVAWGVKVIKPEHAAILIG